MRNGELKVFSDPVTLRWAGWETTTEKLQYAGWQISANQDVRGGTMQIVARHPNGLSFLTELQEWRYHAAYEPIMRGYPVFPPMQVRALGKVEVVMYGSLPAFSQFSPIDAMPHVHTVTHARLEDYFHFAPVTSPHDLIVPQASVPELLERILQLQQPACEDRAKARVAARLLTL